MEAATDWEEEYRRCKWGWVSPEGRFYSPYAYFYFFHCLIDSGDGNPQRPTFNERIFNECNELWRQEVGGEASIKLYAKGLNRPGTEFHSLTRETDGEAS